MYILLEACQHPGVLRVIYFASLILDIVFTVLPIGLIVMLLIDFSKAVIVSDEKTIKGTKIVIQRIINAMIVFCIPWIVSVFMSLLNGAGLGEGYTECLENARSGNLDYYDKLLEAEENNKGNISKNDNTPNTPTSIAADRLIQVAAGEIGKNNNNGTYGNSTDAWCQQFTRWALKKVNLPANATIFSYLQYNTDSNISGDGASAMWPAFRSSKNKNFKFNEAKAYGGSYTPKKGDIIWYQWSDGYCRSKYGKWNGMQCADHVGIVEYVEGGSVHTIEGNTSSKDYPNQRVVARKEKELDNDEIVAYGAWY